MKVIENQQFDQERALYGIHHTHVMNCTFDGEEDGESPFKETSHLRVKDCFLGLRYPFWHMNDSIIDHCQMTQDCRAALWYDHHITIHNSQLHGIKALRECQNIEINDCDMISPEFGWMCDNIKITNTKLVGEYPFLHSSHIELNHFTLQGKYSFQYVHDLVIRNSYLDTKDAFWHAHDVTVYDSVIKGEYLAWYSENVKLVRCKIIGTQPLCYAKGLVLEDCEMIDTDLSFEYSDVKASIKGSIMSVKNPLSGYICADCIDDIILDENQKDNSSCQICIRQEINQCSSHTCCCA